MRFLPVRLSLRRFKPGLISTVLTVLLFPTLVYLGFWQLARYEYKQALSKQQEESAALPPLDALPNTASLAQGDALRFRQCILKGHFSPSPVFFLDNQILNGKVGYRVLMVFTLSRHEPSLLVDRGWIPLGKTRDTLPALPPLEGPQRLTGILDRPTQGFVLKQIPLLKNQPSYLLQRVDLKAISSLFPQPLYPWILRLHPLSSTSFEGGGTVPADLRREKHLGYAIQWFTMALVSILYYVVINSRRYPHD